MNGTAKAGIRVLSALAGLALPGPLDRMLQAGTEDVLGADATVGRRKLRAIVVSAGAVLSGENAPREWGMVEDADRTAAEEILVGCITDASREALFGAALLGAEEFQAALLRVNPDLFDGMSEGQTEYTRTLIDVTHSAATAAMTHADLIEATGTALNALKARIPHDHHIRQLIDQRLADLVRARPHVVTGNRPRVVDSFVARPELTDLTTALDAGVTATIRS
ncbi:hypothetical protein, partial [Microbacterium sp.]|uniref:hypothetical protein n=1 Tax=Microbacterium sp. TaxID=51671 RepID=UPI003A892F1E